jgi:hypothetical protein
MSGKMSRDKGSRVERQFRDIARSYGFQSDRVPLSGAAAGFKCDVTFTKGGVTRKAEVKARKSDFKQIYALFDTHFALTKDDKLEVNIGGRLVSLSSSLIGALEDCGIYHRAEALPYFKPFKRTFQKLLNLEKLLGEANLLVLKMDRKPFLYVTYR